MRILLFTTEALPATGYLLDDQLGLSQPADKAGTLASPATGPLPGTVSPVIGLLVILCLVLVGLARYLPAKQALRDRCREACTKGRHQLPLSPHGCKTMISTSGSMPARSHC